MFTTRILSHLSSKHTLSKSILFSRMLYPSLTHLPMRYFPRKAKTKTSTLYKPVETITPSQTIRPARLEKQNFETNKQLREAKEINRQRVPGYLPDEARFEQVRPKA